MLFDLNDLQTHMTYMTCMTHMTYMTRMTHMTFMTYYTFTYLPKKMLFEEFIQATDPHHLTVYRYRLSVVFLFS